MAIEATHLLLPQLLVNNNQIMIMNMESVDDTKQSNGTPYFGYNESYVNNNQITNSVPGSRKRSRDNNNSYSNSQTMFLGQYIFSSQIQQHYFEIDQFVKLHSENVRLEIESKRRKTSRTLIAALEEGLQHQLRAKEDEITKMMKLNHALQEKVKSMYIENQIWRELAQTNEATANALRNNLKYVLDCKLGDNIVAAEDAESCCESSYEEYISLRDSTCKTTTIPNPVLKNDSLGIMLCNNCKKKESNVLVLPCRHLCLCSGCASSIDICPVCKSTKSFTLNVHLS